MAKAKKAAPEQEQENENITPEVKAPAKAKKALRETSKTHYQEWRVEIKNKQAEKLKIVRDRVMLTDDQAELLNFGVVEGGNQFAHMYFLPE